MAVFDEIRPRQLVIPKWKPLPYPFGLMLHPDQPLPKRKSAKGL